VVIFSILAIVGFIPVIAIQVKRAHDINMSGFIVFINLLPYVGGFITTILFGFFGPVNTNSSENLYGEDPRISNEHYYN
jgi:uncharacterized membrane protein YhaH (DUF805 family)